MHDMNEVIDLQRAQVHAKRGTLHRGTERCQTCEMDLSKYYCCPNAPLARCGCPLFLILDGEHLPRARRHG